MSPSSDFPQLKLAFRPAAAAEAMVVGPNVRFSVLTARLIRMEYSPSGQFEDRPSQAFWYRQQPVPAFSVTRDGAHIEIRTAQLKLSCQAGPGAFNPATLSVDVAETGAIWTYGKQRDRGNLLGTARTLDGADGYTRLEPGLMSRNGWAVVDDSKTLVFDENGWIAQRAHPENLDLYFFGYGHDYAGCLRDYARVAGEVPLLPRWALGNWWSRYWAYTQAELQELIADFQQYDIPLSVCIVDMDWHITHTGNESSGWTGYTWNHDLFPDPAGFIAWLHENGLKTALNLHPADGVYPHEAQYSAMAAALSVDTSTGRPIDFNLGDPNFARAYFEILHHPLEADGVDFWWIDWQQGARSQVAGLDPLMWLNHLHFYDLARAGSKRRFIFSRWFGLGNHRYPIGFSGDTVVTWDSLAFQPYFTTTAANVGFGWWSHDIGGHMGGFEDAELYARWVQFGAFSPILRLHSTNNPYQDRRPWRTDAETLRVIGEAMRLRHALIPYLYSMAWRNHTQAVPLITPMYYAYPDEDDAYRCPQQYHFGTELIAAPYVSPRDADTRLSRQTVWLPAGNWFNFFTGEHYFGDRWHTLYGRLDDIPVFARAGAIVPLTDRVVGNPDQLDMIIFPAAANRFELYEDDGESLAYQQGRSALTAFTQAWRATEAEFTIDAVRGDVGVVPVKRTYRLIFRGIQPPDRIGVRVNGQPREVITTYDSTTDSLTIEGLTLSPLDCAEVIVTMTDRSLMAGRDRRAERARALLREFRLDNWLKLHIDQDWAKIVAAPDLLQSYPGIKDVHVAALRNIIESRE
jgi:alpha-glucosidase (family GH31 glycosyl hydrolase)